MSRINVVSTEQANEQQLALYKAIEQQLGIVPNFLKVKLSKPISFINIILRSMILFPNSDVSGSLIKILSGTEIFKTVNKFFMLCNL